MESVSSTTNDYSDFEAIRKREECDEALKHMRQKSRRWRFNAGRRSLQVDRKHTVGPVTYDLEEMVAYCTAGNLGRMLEGCRLVWFVEDTLEPVYWSESTWFTVAWAPPFASEEVATAKCLSVPDSFEFRADLVSRDLRIHSVHWRGWEDSMPHMFERPSNVHDIASMLVFKKPCGNVTRVDSVKTIKTYIEPHFNGYTKNDPEDMRNCLLANVFLGK